MTTLSVLAAQKGLTQLGYEPGPIDGIKGERTGVAISRWKATFQSRYGTRPTVDTSADLRSLDILPPGAWGELKRAADAYDVRMAAEDPDPPPTASGSAGAGLVLVLAIAGGAWWLSRKARGGLRGCPSCGGVSHHASGSVLPSGKIVCGPCVRSSWSWFAKHGEKKYRVGPRGRSAKYIAFPTSVTKPRGKP